MNNDFDPYYKWLGIPPSDQPANHYRLLGVELFESDPDVIEGAADKQMAFLRTFQSGKNGAISQKLLNEISKARISLLDPQKRAEYDVQLRMEVAQAQQRVAASQFTLPPEHLMPPPTSAPVASPAAPRLPLPAAPQVAAPGSVLTPANPVKVRQNKYYPRRRAGNKMFLSVVLALLSVFILGLIILFAIGIPQALLKSEQALDNKSANTDDAQANTNTDQSTQNKPDTQQDTKSKGKQTESKKDDKHKSTKQDEQNTKDKSKSGTEVKSPDQEPVMEDGEKKNSKNNDAKTENTSDGESKTENPDKDPGEPPIDLRIAAPDPDALRELDQQIEKEFELSTVAKGRAQVELARRLVSKAKTETDDNLRYALYVQALNLSAKAESAGTKEIFDEFATQFTIDRVQFRASLLKLNADSIETKSGLDRLIRESQEFVGQAVAENRWLEALEVYERICKATEQPFAESFHKAMLAKQAELTAQYQQWQEYQQSVEILTTDPENAQANSLVGSWLCFRKQDWQAGLPLLAKSEDEQLKLLAETDLSAGNADLDQRIAAGDGWWEAGEKLADGLQAVYRQRAAHWYQLVVPELPFGKKDPRLLKRLAQVNPVDENAGETTANNPPANAQSAKLVPSKISINSSLRIENLVFVPGKLRLLTVTSEGVRAWDLPSGDELYHVDIDRKNFDPQSLAAYPDGIHFAGKYEEDYVVWNLKTGEIVATLKDSSPAGAAIAFSPDGEMIAGATEKDTLVYWKVESLDVVKSVDLGRPISPKCLKFSPNGDSLAAASVSKAITIGQNGKTVDLPLGKILGSPIRDVEFSADGRYLAACRGDESIFVWDAQDAGNYQVLKGQKGQIKDLVFLPAGKLLVSVSDALGDAELCVWNVETLEIIQSIPFDSNASPNVSVTSDGQYLAAPGEGDAIQIYEIEYQ